MKRLMWMVGVCLLAAAWVALLPPPAAQAQIGGMTCIECHGDPLQGGFHGGFRALTGLSSDAIDDICIGCHDGSYTSPQGVAAPEAAVHQNNNPDPTRDEYGAFKAGCLDCHHIHTTLLAGDGGTRSKTISTPPDANVDESHDVDITTSFFYLDETLVVNGTIVISDDTGTAFLLGTDYEVSVDADRTVIEILAGGAIATAAPITVFAEYDYGANRQLLGVEVRERNATDQLARIRQPIIVDPNGDSGDGTARGCCEDDYQDGWYCSSSFDNDPTCLPDQVRELSFYGDIYEGTPWSSNGGVNMWANDVPPYNGACNSCHTRTHNHRRDGSGGTNQSHNIDKAGCLECHFHKDGWVNKGG